MATAEQVQRIKDYVATKQKAWLIGGQLPSTYVLSMTLPTLEEEIRRDFHTITPEVQSVGDYASLSQIVSSVVEVYDPGWKQAAPKLAQLLLSMSRPKTSSWPWVLGGAVAGIVLGVLLAHEGPKAK